MNSEAKPSAPGTPPAEDPANAQDRESQPAPPESDAPEHDAVYYGEDALADEWGDESFPASDPPAHY